MMLACQLLAGVHAATAAETKMLGTKSGLDPEQIDGAVTGTAGGSCILGNRGGRWRRRRHSS